MTTTDGSDLGQLVARLLHAQSIVVVGASESGVKPSGRTLRYLRRYGYRGRVYPVNPTRETVQGHRAYARIADLPEVPDLAVIAVAGEQVRAAVEECGAHGIGCAVIFSAGFAETGEAGAALQRELVETARRCGVRLIGPNCVGVVAVESALTATFMTGLDQDRFELRDDGLAFVSQSGAMGGFLLNMGQTQDLGIGRFVSTGNEADLGLGELMHGLIDEGSTRAVLAYVEGIRDGEALVSALEAARRRDVPVCVMKVGRSQRGARAAESHTGALAGSDRVFSGLLDRYGVPRADDIGTLLDVGRAFVAGRRPRGRRVSVVTLSGGAGALVTDYAEDLGLDVFPWEGEPRRQMAALLPEFASVENPIDTTGAIASDPTLLTEALRLCVDHPQTDIALVLLGNLEAEEEAIIAQLLEVAASTDKPVFVAWVGGSGRPQRVLNRGGVPTFDDPIRAMRALAALATWSLTPAPQPAPLLAGEAQTPPAADWTGPILDEAASKALLADHGVPVTRERRAATPSEAVAAAEDLGFPVVMKLGSSEIEHKSDLGGVKLGLTDAAAAREAADELLALAERLTVSDADLLVAEQIDPGAELILGSSLDPVFGPVTLVGSGGILTEIIDDVQVRPAPVTAEEARTMLTALRGSAILEGARGFPAADLDAVAAAVARFSAFTAQQAATLESVDINPLMIRADGTPVAVDAVVRHRAQPTDG